VQICVTNGLCSLRGCFYVKLFYVHALVVTFYLWDKPKSLFTFSLEFLRDLREHLPHAPQSWRVGREHIFAQAYSLLLHAASENCHIMYGNYVFFKIRPTESLHSPAAPACVRSFVIAGRGPAYSGVLFTKVRTPVSVRKFCVRTFFTYVRNAIHKTFLLADSCILKP